MKSKTERIKNAVKTLNLENKKTYSAGELRAISIKAKVDELDVMCYLRYGMVF